MLQVGTEDAENLDARLRDALDASGVPSSIGSAPFSGAEGFSGACAAADAAMYVDKRARRGGDRA